jgi:hypothetical protein
MPPLQEATFRVASYADSERGEADDYGRACIDDVNNTAALGYFSSMEACQRAASTAKMVNAEKPVQFVSVQANDEKASAPGPQK